MKLSEKPHIKARIERFKAEVSCAKTHGVEIQPDVNGAYACKNGRVIGRRGSKEYEAVTTNTPLE
jgi:hypothetical protein